MVNTSQNQHIFDAKPNPKTAESGLMAVWYSMPLVVKIAVIYVAAKKFKLIR